MPTASMVPPLTSLFLLFLVTGSPNGPSDGLELSVYRTRRALAPPHAWLGLRALRCSGRRFRGRDYHLYGVERSQANDWRPPEQSGDCSLHWTRVAATVRSGENLSRAQRGILAGGRYGYKAIQSTKPQTLGYALNDSPAGLAAWILEKWRSWADSRGNLDERISRDFLLTTVTLYWVTQTITSSMRDYFDNDNKRFRITLGQQEFVDVPTGIAVFANNFVDEGTPPREWAERLYNVRRWTPMPRGGHFAAAEEPELIARDIAAFFAGL